MGTKTLFLALILLLPNVWGDMAEVNEAGASDACDPIHAYTDPPNATVEPECIPSGSASAADLPADPGERPEGATDTCDPVHVYTDPPNVTVEPECVPIPRAEESK